MKSTIKIGFMIFIGTALFTLSSCSKDDNDNPKKTEEAAGTAQFVDKDFMLSDYNVSVNGFDVYTFDDLDSCDKDDITSFFNDNTGIINTGTIHCEPDESQELPFTWALASNGTKLEMEREEVEQVFDIITNTGAIFKIQHTQIEQIDEAGQTQTTILSITFAEVL